MLGRGELRCIGATTLDEYHKYIEKDPALERRFQQVYVDQPSVTSTIAILRGLRERYVTWLVLSARHVAVVWLPSMAGAALFIVLSVHSIPVPVLSVYLVRDCNKASESKAVAHFARI